jgi:hypothetical protein
MRVGDLVQFRRMIGGGFDAKGIDETGVILNTWKNHKKKLLSVDLLMASDGTIGNVNIRALKVVNESR